MDPRSKEAIDATDDFDQLDELEIDDDRFMEVSASSCPLQGVKAARLCRLQKSGPVCVVFVKRVVHAIRTSSTA